MSRKSRIWESEHDTARSDEWVAAHANNADLARAISIASHSTAGDLTSELGSTRAVALQILERKGKEANKKNVSNEMRNVQRYLKFQETGVKSKNSLQPSKSVQTILNDIANSRRKKTRKLTVEGPCSVAGYERDRDRKIAIDISSDRFRRLVAATQGKDKRYEDAWTDIAAAYGVSEFHALKGSTIDIED